MGVSKNSSRKLLLINPSVFDRVVSKLTIYSLLRKDFKVLAYFIVVKTSGLAGTIQFYISQVSMQHHIDLNANLF